MNTKDDRSDFEEFIKGQKAESVEEWEGSIVVNFESGNSVVFFYRDGKQQMEVV